MKVYISGPMSRKKDLGAGWRQEWRTKLGRLLPGTVWLDPTEKHLKAKRALTDEETVEADLTEIRRADTVLVNLALPVTSTGSIMETAYAWLYGDKQTVVVVKRGGRYWEIFKDKVVSPWLSFHATAIVPVASKDPTPEEFAKIAEELAKPPSKGFDRADWEAKHGGLDEFVRKMEQRLFLGTFKYGGDWVRRDLSKDMGEELLDLANYAYLLWLRTNMLKSKIKANLLDARGREVD